MAKAAAPKASGKGLNGKVAGIPVKIVIMAVAGIAVIWYMHRRSANQAVNSAGTTATPTPATDTKGQTADGTGGVTNADLLAELQALDTDLLVLAAGLPTYSYSTSTMPKQSSTGGSGGGGGNTSAAPRASSPTAPSSSHPSAALLSQQLGGVPANAIYDTAMNAYLVPKTGKGGGGKLVLD